MQRRLQGLLNRDGRYFARLVIPKELRPFLDGKTELREALGPDKVTAKNGLHGAMARLQAKIAGAEQRKQLAAGEPIKPGRYPLPVEQIAARHYHDRIETDTRARNTSPAWASVGIDDIYVNLLRQGLAGRLPDDTLDTVIGNRISLYRSLGNTTAEKGTDDWRALARSLCEAELEALSRVAERDDGDFSGQPTQPHLAADRVPAEPDPDDKTFNKTTFAEVIEEKERLTAMGLSGKPLSPATLKKYRQAIHEFEHFRRDKRLATVTLDDAERWRDHMLTAGKFTRKTILDKLAAIRAVVAWGQRQSRNTLFPNGLPFMNLELPTLEERDSADRTYTLEQARKVLEASRLEKKAAWRWIPWMLAYSGMRVSEALQLEKADFFQVRNRWFFHIRVGDGRSTKTGKGRKVPIHPALVDEGLIEFVQSAPDGKLFPGTFQDQRLREWLHEGPLKEYAERPAPNHGFRHLFEDALSGDVGHRAALYITGRTTGGSEQGYGGSDLKLLELAEQMDRVKRFL